MSRGLLEVEGLTKGFVKEKSINLAVDSVDLKIMPRESLGLVGESGCGKSTLARLITHLEKPDSGKNILDGEDITHARGKLLRQQYKKIQMVFQDPISSFNSRKTIGDSILEVLANFYGGRSKDNRKKIPQLMEMVGLKPEYALRYPHQLSGGECQRAAIARAIAVEPKIIICDEATSALDVSVQAQILSLLQRLKKEMNMTYLFISHDLAVVSSFCENIAVMYQGCIVETGSTHNVINHPMHPYTHLLLASVLPTVTSDRWIPAKRKEVLSLVPGQCSFLRRCPYAKKCNGREKPSLKFCGENHRVACHFPHRVEEAINNNPHLIFPKSL